MSYSASSLAVAGVVPVGQFLFLSSRTVTHTIVDSLNALRTFLANFLSASSSSPSLRAVLRIFIASAIGIAPSGHVPKL